ncbi:MAG: 5-methyltetrahydropteroyltriglutamate--homocysteine S-methyltransferase [Candidatus Omnitrophota bacterium]|nr:5-methyltetrahydropteroyltriglutamate--homocysteine S-methyltransferase [Candidatus Omnitrophota bacterium]MDZ4241298.1 5-methyltetrahydropteroyltriglutamate--homocysteine S-methyltransferase [Candidatus Omnitrophota bacterium]
MKTYAYGFPRLGEDREFKKTVEGFWKGELSEIDARAAIQSLQDGMVAAYEKTVDFFPSGEITLYDQMLDTAVKAGVHRPGSLQEYYDHCRGKNALEMTKWFNTNYHYLVTDFSTTPLKFSPEGASPVLLQRTTASGLPFFIGPFTFLKLSKGLTKSGFAAALRDLAAVYRELLRNCPAAHVEEPAFVLDLTAAEVRLIRQAYRVMAESGCKIHLITYYGTVDFYKELCGLPVAAVGLDFVQGPENRKNLIKHGFPKDKTLIAGLVSGRNVWRTDVTKAVALLRQITKAAPSAVVSNAAPLYHLPITLQCEDKLEPQLKQALSFAKEKLDEIRLIAGVYDGRGAAPALPKLTIGINGAVRRKVKALKPSDFTKKITAVRRKKIHREILGLPAFPTTTIGSFPQTAEVRKMRAEARTGRITQEHYRDFVRSKIRELIALQESWGLDVLVHGEFERTDMVEFFAEKLDGIDTTAKGWIISYGTRTYRPPIIFGDVSRPAPMTVDEIAYAQSLTRKPVKGMLTGPVTIIAWSFVREDIPLRDVAYQIALALRAEIRDYEKQGIRIVQVDEPAIREKAPVKRRDWPAYFDWAVKSFRLTANTDPKTQIHTHMCYSEFGEIVDQIGKMDFDVISIETCRSRGDIIRSFEKIRFNRQIGLGVWDIHSPAVPGMEQMREVVGRALRVIPKENFWINPDCGLKTRDWPETTASLKNLVALANELRRR